MKTLLLFCFLLLSIHARADLILTQMIETNGQSQTNTIQIKGDMIRADSAATSSIINTGNGDTIVLNGEKKTFLRISGSQAKSMTDKLQAMMHSAAASTPAERPKLVDTGKSEKVNDYVTEVYTAQAPVGQFTYWVAKDYPNGAALKAQMTKLQKSMENKLGSMGNFMPDTSTLPGVAVKTEMSIYGRTTTTTLVSVKETTVDDALFQVPAGYTETAMPGMNFGPGGEVKRKPSN